MNLLKYLHFIIFSILVLLTKSASAEQRCDTIFIGTSDEIQSLFSERTEELRSLAKEGYASPHITAFKKLTRFASENPDILEINNGVFYRKLIEVIYNEAQFFEHKIISEIIDSFSEKSGAELLHPTQQSANENLRNTATTAESFETEFKKHFFLVLKNYYGPDWAQKKVAEAFADDKIFDLNFININFKESQKGILGQNSPQQEVNPQSLLQLFLNESSIALDGKMPAMIEADFLTEPIEEFKYRPPGLQSLINTAKKKLKNITSKIIKPKHGPKRLFIAIDARTAPIHYKYFIRNPLVLTHFHTPFQTTLELSYNANLITYTKYTQLVDKNRYGSKSGLVLPTILFSSSEASRLLNYFELGTLTNTRTKYPWAFVHKKPASENEDDSNPFELYCLAGGYTSCTHWFGDIPVGDQYVNRFMFPGYVDNYASLKIPDLIESAQKQPRVSSIGSYTHIDFNASLGRYYNFTNEGNFQPILNSSRTDRLTHFVWQHEKSPAQLWEVLGLEKAQAAGALANPGYVLYSLLGSASSERVPIVFVVTPDSTQPLTQDAIDKIADSIQAY